MRRFAASALAAIVLLISCAPGAQQPPEPSTLAFTDEGLTQYSTYRETEPRVEFLNVGIDRLVVTVYQGQKPTGGYQIRVEEMRIQGTELRIYARLTVPAPDEAVTQAFSSPSHTVGLTPDAPLEAIVLYDQERREIARLTGHVY